MLDASHPFFRPLWIRLLVTAICCGWALFEGVTGYFVWALLFGAAGAWCIYALLIAYTPPPQDQSPPSET